MLWKTIPQHLKLVGRTSQIVLRNIYTSNHLRKNLYEALGLSRDATQADIKNAYFELSKMYHPDKIAATDENLAKFREISAAYEILGNEQSRKLYDMGLIGESDRPGFEAADEITDPMIKFYKQRQALSKTVGKSEDVQSWTPPLKKFAKSKVSQKYNYFRKGTNIYVPKTIFDHWYAVVVVFVSCYLFKKNFSPLELH